MNELLKKVKDIKDEVCVSIIMNTHRTRPDFEKDPISLKNHIKAVEERLSTDYDKKIYNPILHNLNKLAESLDHSFNLESLVIFANQDFADYTRLPLTVEDRVVIDKTFATRDLVRAMHAEAAYYILVLSRQQARLIEAYTDKTVKEFGGVFPIENSLYSTSKGDNANAALQDNLIEEFFNQVDKELIKITKENPLPILLATETRNYDYYYKVADKKDLIMGHINRNRDDDKPVHIVKDAWGIVLEAIKKRNADRIIELNNAAGTGKLVSDLSEIWNAINQGRGKTLFVKRGFFQKAIIDNDNIIPVSDETHDSKIVSDDIVDEMIEHTLAFGGEIVFVEGNELNSYQNLALTTRY